MDMEAGSRQYISESLAPLVGQEASMGRCHAAALAISQVCWHMKAMAEDSLPQILSADDFKPYVPLALAALTGGFLWVWVKRFKLQRVVRW
jgi:hypothetical protein